MNVEPMQMHLLADVLAKEGRVGSRVAAAIGDALVQLLIAKEHTPALLLRLRPECIEVGVMPDTHTAQARIREDSSWPLRPYLAWPELFDAWSGRISLAEAGGESAAVYVVAALVRHLVSGAPMFIEDDLLRLAGRHRREDPPMLPTWLVPKPLARVIDSGVARRPEQRFASLAALRVALSGAVSALLRQAQIQLRTVDNGRVFALTRIATPGPDGSLEVRVGRSDPRREFYPEIDLRHARGGAAVHRRQAILRCERSSGWSVEEWSWRELPTCARGGRTAVNGVPLNDAERRPILPGDLVAFGPVTLRVEISDAAAC